jgi:hypothetical protein
MKYWRNKMLISQNDLEGIIKEEIEKAIDEGWLDRMIGKGSGLASKAAGAMSGLGAKAARGLGADTAAGEMEARGAARTADAPNQEKLGLMKQHARKFSIMSSDMIKDAKKLELLTDPNFKKALAATKAVATRLNNIVAAWEKAPEEMPGGESGTEQGAVDSANLIASLAAGDPVVYTDAKGKQKRATMVKVLDTKDAQGDPQVQLKSGSATFAVDQRALDLDKEVADRQSAGSPPVQEILKRIVREELEKLSK